MANKLCVCGHRRPVAHPNGGPCYDNVDGKRCKRKKYQEKK